ncbi:helix-turn-helix domain-containing protein [Microvirga splendida]|uniref:Helix-turn-helix domain-containing protein n=1 Tax=Microvirga splendida TaxID=2795727 RepID=A0ABS0XYM9_9HYPH|nr:helix-turn-helix domain-containing protein [Microvirga splendida]
MAARTWSTDTVGTSEGFSFWHEAVCQAVLNVSTEAPSDGFQASISSQSVDGLRFAYFSAASHEIVRKKAHIARSSDEHYLISLQHRGQSQISQGDAVFLLDAGEIAILDGQRPFRVGFPTHVQRVLAVIPRKSLDTRAPWLRKGSVRKIVSSFPYASLARRHLLQLARPEAGLGVSEATLLTENLCNLLALATARDPEAQATHPDVQLEEVLAFSRRHLSDPELSPGMIAAHCRISVRTVHLRFERIGQTFGRWLVDNRLEACQRDLREPRQLGSAISEIAYRWGFSDLSHFNKAFRSKFGMTPREWRASAR